MSKPDINRLNNISPKANKILNILLFVYTLMCVLPLFLVLAVSLSDENSLFIYGFSFIPKQFSTAAYDFIFSQANQVVIAYGISIFVTLAGTAVSVMTMALYAYPISRKDFKYKNFFTFYLILTMLYSGGLVATYLVGVRVLQLKDNLLGLILPYMMNVFSVVILRTFFQTNVPDSLIESAKIDGAGEFRTFFTIVFPLAMPGIATVALLAMIQYWNDWFLASIYINDLKLAPLPYLLYQVQISMNFLLQNSSNIGAQSGSILANMPNETARMAMAVICVGPVALTFPFFQKYFVKGMTVGAIKG
jgi:putative aldouronate transport system permease protein